MSPALRQPDTISVQVSDDRLRAELVVPHHVSLNGVTAESLRPLLDDADVAWTDALAERLTQMLSQARTPGKAMVGVIARGRSPRHGEDGRLEWTIDAQLQHQADDITSHYDRSAFVIVARGRTLGRVIPPTPGEPGLDVAGRDIPAQPGKPVAFNLDDSITQQPDGTLVAAAAGLLVRRERAAFVEPVLTVEDCVDFSTGNIDFEGSIIIRRGIKDRFVVKATENVQINGLVEAATIHCGGDLSLNGGFAGREHGAADVGGNLHARYLDGITATVRGNLAVTREIINCHVTVHGQVNAPGGSIVGGRLVVAGKLQAANLGSGGSAPTRIVVGTVPRLDPMLAKLRQFCDDYRRRIAILEKQTHTLTELSEREGLNDAQTRRLAELAQELEQLRRQHRRAKLARDALQMRIDAMRIVDVSVVRRLNEGVLFEHQGVTYRVRNTVNGPVQVCLDPDGTLIYETASAGGPLREIADVSLSTVAAA